MWRRLWIFYTEEGTFLFHDIFEFSSRRARVFRNLDGLDLDGFFMADLVSYRYADESDLLPYRFGGSEKKCTKWENGPVSLLSDITDE